MSSRKQNFFHGHRVADGSAKPPADKEREASAEAPAPSAAPDPAPSPGPPARRPWSIFHSGPAWPNRRTPDQPK